MKKLIIILSWISLIIGVANTVIGVQGVNTFAILSSFGIGIFCLLIGIIGFYIANKEYPEAVSDRYDEGVQDGVSLTKVILKNPSVDRLTDGQYNQLLYDLLHSDNHEDILNITKKEYMPMVTNAQIAGHSDSKDYYQEVIEAAQKQKDSKDILGIFQNPYYPQ